MIKVDLSLFSTLSLLFVLTLFLLIWAHQEGKKRFRSLDKEEGYLWQCSICTFIYLDPEEDHLSLCPRCQSFNKRMPEREIRHKGKQGTK